MHLSERHLFRRGQTANFSSLACVILQKLSERCDVHSRQRITLPPPKTHVQHDHRNPGAVFFLPAKRFPRPTNGWMCYLVQMCRCHQICLVTSSLLCEWLVIIDNFYCHWNSHRKKRSQFTCFKRLWSGTSVAAQVCLGISGGFGKDNRSGFGCLQARY